MTALRGSVISFCILAAGLLTLWGISIGTLDRVLLNQETLATATSDVSDRWWDCATHWMSPHSSPKESSFPLGLSNNSKPAWTRATSVWTPQQKIAAALALRCGQALLRSTQALYATNAENQTLINQAQNLTHLVHQYTMNPISSNALALEAFFTTTCTPSIAGVDLSSSVVLTPTNGKASMVSNHSDLIYFHHLSSGDFAAFENCAVTVGALEFSTRTKFTNATLLDDPFSVTLGQCTQSVSSTSSRSSSETPLVVAVEVKWKSATGIEHRAHLSFITLLPNGINQALSRESTSLKGALWSLHQEEASATARRSASNTWTATSVKTCQDLGYIVDSAAPMAIEYVKLDTGLYSYFSGRTESGRSNLHTLPFLLITLLLLGLLAVALRVLDWTRWFARARQNIEREERSKFAEDDYRVETTQSPKRFNNENQQPASNGGSSLDGADAGGGDSDLDYGGDAGTDDGIDNDVDGSFMAPERSTVANAEDLRFSCGLNVVGENPLSSGAGSGAASTSSVGPPKVAVLVARYAHYRNTLDDFPNVAEAQLRLLVAESKDVIFNAVQTVDRSCRCSGLTAEVFMRPDATLVAVFHGGSNRSNGRLEAALKSANALRQLVASKREAWQSLMVELAQYKKEIDAEDVSTTEVSHESTAGSSLSRLQDSTRLSSSGRGAHTQPSQLHFAELSMVVSIGQTTLATHGSENQTTSAFGGSVDVALGLKDIHPYLGYPGIVTTSEVAQCITDFHQEQSNNVDSLGDEGGVPVSTSPKVANSTKALKLPNTNMGSLGHYCAVPIDAVQAEEGVCVALTDASKQQRGGAAAGAGDGGPSPRIALGHRTLVIYELLEVDHQTAARHGFLPSTASTKLNSTHVVQDIVTTSSSFNGLTPSDTFALGALCRSLSKMLSFITSLDGATASTNGDVPLGKIRDALATLQEMKDLVLGSAINDSHTSQLTPETHDSVDNQESSAMQVSGLTWDEGIEERTLAAMAPFLRTLPINPGKLPPRPTASTSSNHNKKSVSISEPLPGMVAEQSEAEPALPMTIPDASASLTAVLKVRTSAVEESSEVSSSVPSKEELDQQAKASMLMTAYGRGELNNALYFSYRKFHPLATHLDRLIAVCKEIIKRAGTIVVSQGVAVNNVSLASAGIVDSAGNAVHQGGKGPHGPSSVVVWPRTQNRWESFNNDLLERRAAAFEALRAQVKSGGNEAPISKEKQAQLFRTTMADGEEMLVDLKQQVEERVAIDAEKERKKQERLEARVAKAAEKEAEKEANGDGGDDGGGFMLFSFMPTGGDSDDEAEDAADEEEGLEEEPWEFTDRHGNVWRRSGRELGKGAFGNVFLGMGSSGNLVAIKAMSIKKIDTSECEAVTKEVALLTRLRHENVVEYLSSAIVGNYFMIVMEAIGGGSLFQTFVQYTKLNEPTLRRYLLDIIGGLRYLHMNGVLHRDIKPQNVLLTAQGQCKLADFGTSTFMGQRNALKAGDIQGTILYMAPEACVGATHPRSDIWSLGIMTYYLATGEFPWHKADVQLPHIILNKLGKDPTYKPNLELLPLGSPLRNFIQSCLRMDPELRPSADELMRDAFMVAVPRKDDDEE